MKNHYGDKNPAERRNLSFLLGLRNKIEHRHLPELDAALYGECQAALMNLEDRIVREFGETHALADQLAVALQFSRTTPAEKRDAARVLASTAAKSVREYVERFRGNLPSSVLSSMKYSFNVFLVPKVSNRQSMADTAIQFVHTDEASSEELARLEKLNVLIREKHIPIANLDLFKPSQVVEELKTRLPFKVSMSTHTNAWRYHKVRPAGGASKPETTASEFCIYDPVHRDYLYTRAWIEKLVRELSSREMYRKTTGRDPVTK